MDKQIIDFTQTPLTEIYGENCFNDSVMRVRLPKSIYKAMKEVQEGGADLTIEVAEVVAEAMKDWAIEKGATHYTHWFQPLTGLTAEKHDSFISPTADGRVMMEFSGKELIKGEPDASSFPSGGLRATFEARGYTAWDTTSPAFLKKDNTGVTLYIPTAFVSYTGEALDKKVPLLRSMEALEIQTLRVLRALGNTTAKKINTTVGPEQEYFLIDKNLYEQRSDLLLTGRTVFGSMPAKGQEMDDHYFGSIKDNVADFMRELNYELWLLGISAKTQHNEVAPNQFELAPIFDTANVATDRNQLVMDTIKKVASRHNLVALLHEKPFAGVNGSGKHNNWSMTTDDGVNLLNPGNNPQDNAQFLLFLASAIKAVDKYAPILRMSAANAGNDHRLGANEAPPAIISIFLGELLEDILDSVANDKPLASSKGEKLEIGVSSLPDLPKDLTDRNRTSPFAFTGNKFEFRMVPSSDSIAGPNVILNTAIAEVLSEAADKLEKASDKNKALKEIIKESYNSHKRVIFNGNGYSDEWVTEATKRGLPNIKSTIEAIVEITKDYSVDLFGKHSVFTKPELESREEIYLEKYAMQINIEASIMIEMSNSQIYPAVLDYARTIADSIIAFREAAPGVSLSDKEDLLKDLLETSSSLRNETKKLEKVLAETQAIESTHKLAKAYREKVFAQMANVRTPGDKLEKLMDKDLWPFPNYEDLLFTL